MITLKGGPGKTQEGPRARSGMTSEMPPGMPPGVRTHANRGYSPIDTPQEAPRLGGVRSYV
eukprot:4796849-Pyramimonas_sp.AAC.1